MTTINQLNPALLTPPLQLPSLEELLNGSDNGSNFQEWAVDTFEQSGSNHQQLPTTYNTDSRFIPPEPHTNPSTSEPFSSNNTNSSASLAPNKKNKVTTQYRMMARIPEVNEVIKKINNLFPKRKFRFYKDSRSGLLRMTFRNRKNRFIKLKNNKNLKNIYSECALPVIKEFNSRFLIIKDPTDNRTNPWSVSPKSQENEAETVVERLEQNSLNQVHSQSSATSST